MDVKWETGEGFLDKKGKAGEGYVDMKLKKKEKGIIGISKRH